jgi:TusA-related sulfurtransferase
VKIALPAIALLAASLSLTGFGSQKNTGAAATEHYQGVVRRGDKVMGFSHLKATHHFRLFTDGGEIEVLANDPHDTATRRQIRTHLAQIAKMFAAGNFEDPKLIHAVTPPGVPTMKKLRARITWRFEPTARGGRVEITTKDPQALRAVHEFLRFQISDHQTGDPTKITKRKQN